MGSLPGFGIGITIAFLQSEGKSPDNQILLKRFKRSKREASGRCFNSWCISSGPAEVSWALRRASRNYSIDKCLLYTSALSDENVIVCFSAFLRTDAKASVLKAEEEL